MNKDPRSYYRMVRRVTGLTWGDVLRRGPDWVIARFVALLEVREGTEERLEPAGTLSEELETATAE